MRKEIMKYLWKDGADLNFEDLTPESKERVLELEKLIQKLGLEG